MAQTDIQINVESLARQLGKAQGKGDQWKCLCPTHEDKEPSLSLSWKNGKLLWNCQAGCSQERVLEAFKQMGVFGRSSGKPEKIEKKKGGKKKAESTSRKIVKTYDYTDSAGNLIFQSVRYEPKTFKLRRPDGKNGWTWSVPETDRILFNLPAVLEAAAKNERVVIVEGEKDVETLRKLNIVATTNPTGAVHKKEDGTLSKWNEEMTNALKGANCVIVPDHDQAGYRHANAVAEALHNAGIAVSICELPGVELKQDVTDWWKPELGEWLLEAALEDSAKWTPETPAICPDSAKSDKEELPQQTESSDESIDNVTPLFPGQPINPDLEDDELFTDTGNGQRFSTQHGENVRHADGGGWFIWDGKRYKPASKKEIRKLARLTARSIAKEIDAYPQYRTELKKWHKSSLDKAGLDAMLNEAESWDGIGIELEQLDSLDPYLINAQNGVIDLRSGDLLPHDRKYGMSRIMACDYDPMSDPVKWLDFLVKVTNNDWEMIRFLQRLAGLCMTALTGYQKFFLVYGDGGNGKSVFLNTIQRILGSYAVSTRAEMWMKTQFKDHVDNTVQLAGCRFIGGGEIAQDHRLNESLVKDVTGGEIIPGRKLFSEPIYFKPVGKLLFRCNTLPSIRETNEGVWRRVMPIPFDVAIPENEKILDLDKELESEYPAIAAWMAAGVPGLETQGLNPPEKVERLLEQYKIDQNPLRQFIENGCTKDASFSCQSLMLYKGFEKFCKESNLRIRSVTWFGKELPKLGYERYDSNGKAFYRGLDLKPEWIQTRYDTKQLDED